MTGKAYTVVVSIRDNATGLLHKSECCVDSLDTMPEICENTEGMFMRLQSMLLTLTSEGGE